MRFLVDEDVYRITVNWLRDQGHDVVTALDAGLGAATDYELLGEAHVDDRILLTRDTDFGELVFLRRMSISGVILLRFEIRTVERVHEVLAELLQSYSEEKLKRSFCAVTPDGFRRRRIRRED